MKPPAPRKARTTPSCIFAAVAALLLCAPAKAQDPGQRRTARDTTPTLGLEQGFLDLDTRDFTVRLVKASQTIAALRPKGTGGFDFTPADRLERRAANGFFHLGDLTLRLRTIAAGQPGEWRAFSTADARHPIAALPVAGSVLAAGDLTATLPADIPLAVHRFWETRDGRLVLRFELHNRTRLPVEIGALGIPMVFNNILEGRSLDEAHAVSSFHDPYIGGDAGYLQVTRLSGHGPALAVVPHGHTPLEAWSPLLSEPTRRGVTFEGFYEWLPLSRALAETEWRDAESWNPATSATLAPGEARSWGVEFLVAPSIREIEATLADAGRPVAVGIPGYVLPMDIVAKLFLRSASPIASLRTEPAGALELLPAGTTPGREAPAGGRGDWQAYDVRGRRWGRARLTVTYADGTHQTVHYRVVKPATEIVADLGRFLFSEQWYENAADAFGRSPSVISYDYEAKRQVTEDNRAWIAGLGDEGGSGAWLAAVMKQLVRPERAELAKLERFVDGVLWGGLQYADGERMYGVRKSLFYWEPDSLPAGTYTDSVRYGGWSSWRIGEARSTVRSYNYPHVAAAHWVLYRLARNHVGLVENHRWDWYLERAYQTGLAMVRLAPRYAQFGQMDGTVFLYILRDLQREGWTEPAAALEAVMRERADLWRSLGYPFGSEMPWDSTGQEEVYAWCAYFGYDEKALVTLDAILGYMPTLPHWGYNGSARRYWDFQYAGKLRRVERQLHHYGSGLNAIPVLTEYREHPADVYLLRVGYGGLMGAVSNITEDGFGPSAFHAYPSTLRIDGYSGDFGPGFFGHAVSTATYVVRHPEFGWLAFGGNLTVEGDAVRVRPLDSARSRIYLASLGLWLTLEAGTFESVEVRPDGATLTLSPATPATPVARLVIEQPVRLAGIETLVPDVPYPVERGASVIPLGESPAVVRLHFREE
jgi:hypothetical protein